MKSILSNLFHKRKNQVCLEILDDAWSTSEFQVSGVHDSVPTTSRGLSKLNKTLKSVHSTPGNSLDLEWEHLPEMVVFNHCVDKEEALCSATTASAWSRLSSPDSLEWDPVESNLNPTLDAETEELLEEIEKLNSTALRETQEWTS